LKGVVNPVKPSLGRKLGKKKKRKKIKKRIGKTDLPGKRAAKKKWDRQGTLGSAGKRSQCKKGNGLKKKRKKKKHVPKQKNDNFQLPSKKRNSKARGVTRIYVYLVQKMPEWGERF